MYAQNYFQLNSRKKTNMEEYRTPKLKKIEPIDFTRNNKKVIIADDKRFPIFFYNQNEEGVLLQRYGNNWSTFVSQKQKFFLPRGDFRTYHGRFPVRANFCTNCSSVFHTRHKWKVIEYCKNCQNLIILASKQEIKHRMKDGTSFD